MLHGLEYKFSLEQSILLKSASKLVSSIFISFDSFVEDGTSVDVDGTTVLVEVTLLLDDEEELLLDAKGLLIDFSDSILDCESSELSIIKGFFFSLLSVIILYIMNIIYILVILY